MGTRRDSTIAEYPVWYWNWINLFDWSRYKDQESYLGLLLWITPTVNEWIDGTMVIGNRPAERVVRVMDRLYSRFAKLYALTPESKDSGQYLLQKVHQRLQGLIKGMK